jgi:hypothetical protein
MQLDVRTPPDMKVKDSRRTLVYSYPELAAISYVVYFLFAFWAQNVNGILLVYGEI